MKRQVLLKISTTLALGCAALALIATPSVAAGSLPTLTLTTTKNNVVVGGAKVSGAVDVVSTVSGEAEDQPALILLKPGVTPAEFGKVANKLGNGPLDAIDPYATLVFDAPETYKGSPSTAEVDLPAGNYVAVNNGNGYTPFTVTGSASPAGLPKPAATVEAIDFGFRGADTLRDGELVRFENAGYLIHMFVYAKVASVATANKAEALLLAGKMKAAKKYVIAPPGQFAGPLSSGQMEQEVITESPGVYVVLCLMNTQDGREHFQLGMLRTIHIVK